MLTQIDAYNSRGTKLMLPLDIFPSGAQYVIKSVDNLGPVKADIMTSIYAGMSGGIFNKSHTQQRNPVLHIGFNPDFTSSDDPYGTLRRATYPWFTPGELVELHLHDTTLGEVRLTGWVESCEPTIFVREPELTISVICPDPYLYGLSTTTVNRTGPGTLAFTNPGTAPSGFEFELGYVNQAGAGSPYFKFTRTTPPEDGVMSTGWWEIQVFTKTTWIYMNTVKGNKKAVMAQSQANLYTATAENVIGYVDTWLEVAPGDNVFSLDPENVAGAPESPVTMKFVPRYVGL